MKRIEDINIGVVVAFDDFNELIQDSRMYDLNISVTQPMYQFYGSITFFNLTTGAFVVDLEGKEKDTDDPLEEILKLNEL